MKKTIYYSICILLDLAAFLFFAIAVISGAAAGDDILLAGIFLLTIAFLTIISVVSLIKVVRKQGENVVRNSILMKLSVFFVGISFTFFWFDNGIFAFFTFLIPGIFLSAVTFREVRGKHQRQTIPEPNKKAGYSFTYSGKSAWDEAAAEYRRLRHIPAGESLSQEQNRQIYDYTVTPFSYMFYWLADSGFLNMKFDYDYPEENYIGKMRKREITPAEALSEMGGSFSSEYMAEEIIPFFISYYDTGGRFSRINHYLFDYYDAVGNPEDRYYCIDFTWDTAERLSSQIQKRYEDWRGNNQADSGQRYDDEKPFREHVHSVKFSADLDAYRSGIIRNGLLNGNEDEYLAKCMECLDSLSETQMIRLECYFDDIYGTEETPEAASVSAFTPEEIYLFEPQAEGDVVFAVGGPAEFEPEHGISFTVRNGIIIGWGYENDFSDPYSPDNTERYENLSPIDFADIRTEDDAEPYLQSGELVRVKIVPDIPYCAAQGDEKYILLTPRAAEKKKLFEKCIKNIRAYSGIYDLEILYTVQYQKNRDQKPVSAVPKSLYITSADHRKWIKVFFTVSVW